MVGNLAGLGDRHSDNILIKVFTGKICHIDFEMVFNYGEKLPVKEIVPFRLTRSMVDVLGLLKTEGPFLNNCVLIHNILRENRSLI